MTAQKIAYKAPKHYEIEDNVPLPDKWGVRTIYEYLLSLDRGQSFLVPERSQNSVQKICAYAKRQSGFTFLTQKMDGGIRVWRT